MVTAMPWDPKQYHKFQAERSAPFFDLLALVDIRPGLKVIDLGCGTGELTCQLADALPDSDVTGIDSSAQMLEKAVPRKPEFTLRAGRPGAADGEWDLIFSNAALQWTEITLRSSRAFMTAGSGRTDRRADAVQPQPHLPPDLS